jgi:hypothetical protein
MGRTEPRQDNVVGGPCLDLVMQGSGASAPWHVGPGDAVLAPEFLGAMDPGVAGPGLPSSPGLLPPPVN